jgi:hypothetical protein
MILDIGFFGEVGELYYLVIISATGERAKSGEMISWMQDHKTGAQYFCLHCKKDNISLHCTKSADTEVSIGP